jgi:DNA-binding SARP family transcriptional activator
MSVTTGIEYRILGPLEVLTTERVPVSGARIERVLAALLFHPNQAVTVASLVEAVWEGSPPVTATRQARNCVSKLRRTLVSAGAGADVVTTEGAGYRLRVRHDELDAVRFDRRVAAAHAALGTGDLASAVAEFREALDLWRGPAVDGIGSGVIASWAARWNERRLAVLQEYVSHELALGHHQAVLAELVPVVDQHPLCERLVAQLMIALYRAGRVSEALDLYRRTRSRLVDELGLDPGAELDRLHTLMLRRDASLDLRPGG